MKSSLCNYSDAYILVKGTIIVPNAGPKAATNNRNKKVISKNCPPFTDFIREMNNTQIDNAKDMAQYFQSYCQIISIDLSTQQALNTYPKSIQQVSFPGNLDQAGITARFLLLKKQKKLF